MHTRLLTLVALTLLSAALSAHWHPLAASQDGGEGQHVPPAEVLAELDWLAGSWSGDMWGGRFEAFYSTPAGGKILSHSRLLKGATVAFYEFEVFEARDLVVHLQPYPGGKPAEGFTLQAHDPANREVVFENPDKDFPTRITYQRTSDDALLIVLSDPHGESDKVERFELVRQP